MVLYSGFKTEKVLKGTWCSFYFYFIFLELLLKCGDLQWVSTPSAKNNASCLMSLGASSISCLYHSEHSSINIETYPILIHYLIQIYIEYIFFSKMIHYCKISHTKLHLVLLYASRVDCISVFFNISIHIEPWLTEHELIFVPVKL